MPWTAFIGMKRGLHMTCFLINNQPPPHSPLLSLLSLRTGWGGGPGLPRPVLLPLEGGVHGRAQEGGGLGHSPTDTPNLPCADRKRQLWWGQDRVGLGWGRCPNVAPELREQLAQSGQTTDSSIPRAGATGKVSGRTEPEIASLAWRHWRGAFELMPERQL